MYQEKQSRPTDATTNTKATPLANARQAFIDRLEGLDLQSPEFMATEDYIDFWDDFYTNGNTAYVGRKDDTELLERMEERRKNPVYKELSYQLPDGVVDFSRELRAVHGDYRYMTPFHMKALVISELKIMKDQVKERRTQQPPHQ